MAQNSLRARVIAEWRGYAESGGGPDKCAAVGEVIQRLLPKLGLGERVGEAEVRGAWLELVGDFIARHAVPSGLSRGVLTVQVLQPSVRYELESNWRPKILAKLQERFGKKTVREVRFRLP